MAEYKGGDPGRKEGGILERGGSWGLGEICLYVFNLPGHEIVSSRKG